MTASENGTGAAALAAALLAAAAITRCALPSA